jgi:hypothetical protein
MKLRKQISTSHNELDALEAQLAGTLRPVVTPKDMIQRLRERVSTPIQEKIVLRLRDWQSLFFVFSGVMSGMLVVITVARALFYFWGKRHTG